ncbi:MAG: hypothetical protein QGH39_13290, partial [Candidatus Thermoplasmatota archaeon]|nr:hypothetical protein [Candidatus Thermoplasmatota archaeon]
MKINIEDETIELETEVWKDEAALKDDIKGKIDSGNYDVVEESLALRELTTTLEGYTKIELKLTNTFIEECHEKANASGVT